MRNRKPFHVNPSVLLAPGEIGFTPLPATSARVVSSTTSTLAYQIATLASGGLWLRADLGFNASGWQDQSVGGGLIFSSSHLPTLVSSGINGQPTLAGNGANTSLYNTSFVMPTEEFTIYAVAEISSQTSTRAILSDVGGHVALYANSSTTMAMYGAPDQISITYNATTASIYRAVFNGASSSLRASPGNVNTNGSQLASYPGTGGLCIFNYTNGSWFWDKWISEILIIPGAPSATVETYLSTRYGIAVP